MRTCILIIAAIGVGVVAGPAGAQANAPSVRPKALISQLAGTWSFEMFISGRDSPFGKGRREMKLLPDSLKLSWNDEYEGSARIKGAGFLGYDDRLGTYYLIVVSTELPTPTFVLGSATADTIRFDPARTAGCFGNPPGTYILSELRMIGQDRFEWVGGEWRIVFTRAGGA